MFTFILMVCGLNTILMIAVAVRVVVRGDRSSREISRAGNEFLSRSGRN